MSGHESEHEPVVIRDKRRFDPLTGEPRQPDPDRPTPGGRAGAQAAEPDDDEQGIPKADALLLEERTRDLQRLQAEYANYRKRVDRDRVANAESAVGLALMTLLPVLDDIDRARAHGDLTGPFKAVAEQLAASRATASIRPSTRPCCTTRVRTSASPLPRR